MPARGLDLLYDSAESHGGYFTTQQAGRAGISTRLLTYYANTGDIERVAHGVYRLVRFPEHRFGAAIAAALWAGPGSAISHDTALAVYGTGPAMPVTTHVTVPRPFRGRRPGVVIHVAPLDAGEVAVWDDVPVTSIERALSDVADCIDQSLALDAARDALQRGLTTRRRLTDYAAKHPGAQKLLQFLPSAPRPIVG
jgi:predicted transcriptional regulator of viral defense system